MSNPRVPRRSGDDLETLPNIGPRLAKKLRDAGVRSETDLARLGSVKVMLRIAGGDPVRGFNMLYALEGALRGVRWHLIPKNDRMALRSALKDAESGDWL